MSPNPAILTWPRPVVAAGSSYYDEVMTDSPLCYYPLGDSSAPPADATGNTTPTSSTWPTFGATGLGDAATSASFDGSNDEFVVNVGASVSSALTMEALIRVPSSSTGADVMSYGRIKNLAARARVNITTSNLLWIDTDNTSGQDGTTTLAAATTYHVAIVCDGTTMKGYVNGAQDISKSTSFNATTDDRFVVGNCSQTSLDRFFPGLIAGVAAYGTALSAARILAHAQAAGVA